MRVGYKDYPLDNTNKYYKALNDEVLHSIYEGKEGGIDLPFNGLSDYLYKSSYGAMSMKIGEIVDIEMDGTAESYYIDNINDDGEEWRQPFELLNSDEFASKLSSKVNLKDYDSDNWGGADALYIFDVAGDIPWDHYAEVTFSETIDTDNSVSQQVAYLRPRYLIDGDISYDMETIVHETGHLLLKLPDYYMFDNYISGDDIGSIMGYGRWDYDALSKWYMGWLTNDSVIGIEPSDGETGVIELTPYDSDTAEGKKIALFKCGMYYIAVDYCGGLNNNDVESSDISRKKGFRIYFVNDVMEPSKVLIKEIQDGWHELFIENEDLENIFGRGLSITNIQTGDNPSFTYSYSHKESNDRREVELDEPLNVLNINYKISVLDERGNDITDEIKVDFEDITDTDSHVENIVEDDSNILALYFLENISKVDTLVKVSSIPTGYKVPDIVLNLVNSDGSNIEVTSPYNNVEIIIPDNSNVFEVKVLLEKENIENTIQSDESDETTEASKQQDDETTNNQDKHSSSEDATYSEYAVDSSVKHVSNKNTNKQSIAKDNRLSENKSEENSVTLHTKEIVDKNTVVANNNKVPQTGDRNSTPIWLTVAGASIAVITTAIITRRKKI